MQVKSAKLLHSTGISEDAADDLCRNEYKKDCLMGIKSDLTKNGWLGTIG